MEGAERGTESTPASAIAAAPPSKALQELQAILNRLGISPEQTPVVIHKGTHVLHNPTRDRLEASAPPGRISV